MHVLTRQGTGKADGEERHARQAGGYGRLINVLDIMAARPNQPYRIEDSDVVDRCFEGSGRLMSGGLSDHYAELLNEFRGVGHDTWRPMLDEMHELAKSEYAEIGVGYGKM